MLILGPLGSMIWVVHAVLRACSGEGKMATLEPGPSIFKYCRNLVIMYWLAVKVCTIKLP